MALIQCRYRPSDGTFVAECVDVEFVKAVSTATEFSQIASCHRYVVLLGVFDWSNYSQDVVREVIQRKSWFEGLGIGVGAMCIERPEQLQSISAECFAYFQQAKVEPICYVFEDTKLVFSTAGPRALDHLIPWFNARSPRKES